MFFFLVWSKKKNVFLYVRMKSCTFWLCFLATTMFLSKISSSSHENASKEGNTWSITSIDMNNMVWAFNTSISDLKRRNEHFLQNSKVQIQFALIVPFDQNDITEVYTILQYKLATKKLNVAREEIVTLVYKLRRSSSVASAKGKFCNRTKKKTEKFTIEIKTWSWSGLKQYVYYCKCDLGCRAEWRTYAFRYWCTTIC